jgi:uncharacterized protein (DUF1697 family)
VIKMEALRKLYSDLGFQNIKTYIQSGNVLFQHSKSNQQDLEKKISEKIAAEFNFKVPVIVKNIDEMKSVLQNNPFTKKKNIDALKLHVTFLSHEPEQSYVDNIKAINFSPDEFFLLGNIIYLHCPNGYGNSKLNNNFFESKLKVLATTRNWKTVNELVALQSS